MSNVCVPRYCHASVLLVTRLFQDNAKTTEE